MTYQRWNILTTQQRYDFLCSAYERPVANTPRDAAKVNVLSKFACARWRQLPPRMREVLKAVPHFREVSRG